jgi:hypothetical protein
MFVDLDSQAWYKTARQATRFKHIALHHMPTPSGAMRQRPQCKHLPTTTHPPAVISGFRPGWTAPWGPEPPSVLDLCHHHCTFVEIQDQAGPAPPTPAGTDRQKWEDMNPNMARFPAGNRCKSRSTFLSDQGSHLMTGMLPREDGDTSTGPRACGASAAFKCSR